MHHSDDRPACVICRRNLWDDELCRYACRPCEHAGHALLNALPALYRQTADLLQPGVGGGGGRISGSKSAPLPCSEHVLNLRARGGMVTVLATWEEAVREEVGYSQATFRGGFEATLDGAVEFLAINCPWIYAAFAAVDDFHDEIRQLHGRARALVSGEPPARRVTVVCALCDATMRITLDTPGRRCKCGTQYGWAELRQLPLAERAAA